MKHPVLREDDFYTAAIACSRTSTGSWKARISVRRKDSNEVVGGIGELDKERERAAHRAEDRLADYFLTFARPPYEWGRVELRQLIVGYRALDDELTATLVDLKRQVRDGQLSEDRLQATFWETRQRVIAGTVALAQRLEALSERDRIDLMTSPEEAYENPSNQWLLDDMNARDSLYDFLLNPSEAVTKAHEAHRRRWGGR